MKRSFGGWRGGVAALAVLSCASASASAPRGKHAPRPALASPAAEFGAFTPAAADPRIAVALARSGLGSGNFEGGAFRFTPSGTPGKHRAVTVAVRARTISRQDAAKSLALAGDGLAPSAYSLGASVGWKRFALSGDVARVDGGILPIGRESAEVGFSLTGRHWATKVDLAADRGLINQTPAFGLDQSWSVGLGGSYALTRNLNVTGGVRYKTQREELITTDDRRDSQAVYLGTTFKF